MKNDNTDFEITDKKVRDVGKRLRDGVYVQYLAIKRNESILTPQEKNLVFTAVVQKPENFEFDFVFTNGRDKVRLLKMSSLEEPHPHVVESYVFSNVDKSFKKGKIGGQIYHRLDLILSKSDPNYGFHRRVRVFEEQQGYLKPPVPSYPNKWKERIEESGISYKEYLDIIEKLK